MTLALPPRSIWLYAAKVTCAGALAFLLARWLPPADFPWFLVSVMLVLSPNAPEALPLALTRIKANAVGAAVSLLALTLGAPGPWIQCAAFGVTVLLCYAFNVLSGSRSALAAVVIILFHAAGPDRWTPALDRLLSVAAGCLAGLAVTILFHRALAQLKVAETVED